MPIINLAHEEFIRHMILLGDRRSAYLKAYPDSNPNSAKAGASRLLNNPAIRQRIVAATQQAETTAVQELTVVKQYAIATLEDKFRVLTDIINGTYLTTRYVRIKGELTEIKVPPTPNVQMQAIRLYTQLKNGYEKRLQME